MGWRLIRIAALFCVELLLVVLVFQVLAAVECRLTDMETACRALRGTLARALCLFAGIGVFLWARPAARRRFAHGASRPARGRLGWALLHAIGVVVIFAPIQLVPPQAVNTEFATVFTCLAGGGILAAIGGLFWVMPPADWRRWLGEERDALAGIAVLAVLIPDVAALLEPLWTVDALARATFASVAMVLETLVGAVSVDPGRALIGLGDFRVVVASQCSGIEGFALVTGFLAIYAILFRDVLRMTRFWLVVWPLALALSWVFNVLRIAALIWIGARVSPDLAVNGFHSFAGWMAFTLLALAIIATVQSVPWLHRMARPRGTLPSLREDWAAARILPFIVFMISGVAVQALFGEPALGYPLQALAMAITLWWMWPAYRALDWRLDPVSVLVGLGIGVMWVGLAPVGTAGFDPFATLSRGAALAWVAARLTGTVLLVPLVEEAFFRGYVMRRLDTGRWAGRIAAIGVSTLLFAALHGRPFAAGLAGIAFALVLLWRGRLADAVLAHVAANAVVAAVALIQDDWALI